MLGDALVGVEQPKIFASRVEVDVFADGQRIDASIDAALDEVLLRSAASARALSSRLVQPLVDVPATQDPRRRSTRNHSHPSREIPGNENRAKRSARFVAASLMLTTLQT
jgi:hypothetical protein